MRRGGEEIEVKAGPRPPAESVGLPDYAWDQRMRRGRGAYIDLASGRMVGQKDVEGLLRDVIDVSEQAMREFGRMAAQGEMTPQEFYEAMRASSRLAMNAAAALSKGGWAQMSQADWGRNGWLLRQQYEYLAGMTAELATEQTPAGTRGRLTPEQAQARAMLYTDAAWGRFWELEDEKAFRVPGAECRVQTIGDDRVCEICRGEEEKGYRPVAETPALPIHLGCRCKKLYRWPKPVAATKHYGPGDHPGGSPQSVHGRGGGVLAAGEDERLSEEWIEKHLLTDYLSKRQKVWISWAPEAFSAEKKEEVRAMVREIVDALAALEQEWGEKPDFLTITLEGGNKPVAEVLSAFDEAIQDWVLEVRFYRAWEAETLRRDLKAWKADGFLATESLTDAVAHEYGHLLLIRRGREPFAESVFAEYDQGQLHVHLSELAAVSAVEMFAEAFVARKRFPLAAKIVTSVIGAQE